MIVNPILRGFNPDPSIVRVGSDYYIATSTFEWFPGVQIHHSRNLRDWRLVTRPLRRPSQLDLRGVPDSCGVWAPCLTYADDRFHLVYTVVSRYGQTTVGSGKRLALRDFKNYLVTAAEIEGDWSDPVFLNSSGFDPSLFHDDDGRKYLVNMLWDHRPGQKNFAGIVIQEFSSGQQALIGERRLIFEGSGLGFTEGPHLLKREGWYYLIVAEGGTGFNHAVVVARSRALYGPYEASPSGPVLTCRDRPELPLQRAGHGDLVETEDGQWLIAYLCGRPLTGRQRCVMGRETAIQPVVWTQDGWLQTPNGAPVPESVVAWPAGENAAADTPGARRIYTFDTPDLDIDFQWLRTPFPERLFSLAERPGYLRLYGRETVGSQFEQSLLARRQTDFRFVVTVQMDFAPRNFQQSAGLIAYYNSSKFYYGFVSVDPQNGRHLRVLSILPNNPQATGLSEAYAVPPGPLELRMEGDDDRLRFAFRAEGAADWTWLPNPFDLSLLSDEAVLDGEPSFTGTLVGVACQDMSGEAIPADFAWFEYSPR